MTEEDVLQSWGGIVVCSDEERHKQLEFENKELKKQIKKLNKEIYNLEKIIDEADYSGKLDLF